MYKNFKNIRIYFSILIVASLCMAYFSLAYGYTYSASRGYTDIKNILLLNSYHDGYEWSDETKDSIIASLNESGFKYNLKIEHMDTKHINSDEYKKMLYSLYKSKYQIGDFDGVISADDNALSFILEYGDDLFGDTPIFFCGINSLDQYDFSQKDNIYGVVEETSITDTVDMARDFNPGIDNVYFVVDDSISGRLIKKDIENDMAKYKNILNFEIIKGESYEEILDFTKTLDPANTIVVQAVFVKDKNGHVYSSKHAAELLINSSNAPVYSLFNFGFGSGILGGKFVEGHTQGEKVTSMLIEYLNTGSISGDRIIEDNSMNHSYFDYKIIKELDYDVRKIPAESFIINKPVNFYERNERLINISLVILILLLMYVYILRKQVIIQSNKIVKAQKQLIDSEKMASLGRLVAGISHEINTPIGVGVTLSTYMKSETENLYRDYENRKFSSLDLREYLDDMLKSSDLMIDNMKRASQLVKSFKQVAVDQSIDEKRNVELREYLEDVVKSLKSELKKKDIKVSIDSYENLNFYIYTGAIYQIFSNLIMNSIKHGFANKNSGQIDIKIARRRYHYPITKNDEIYIVYRDNGEGIEKENLSKIYDSFYTTKIDEGGSGLGLNIVKSLIVERLKGSIECTSELGKYTQFEIKFPVEYKAGEEDENVMGFKN